MRIKALEPHASVEHAITHSHGQGEFSKGQGPTFVRDFYGEFLLRSDSLNSEPRFHALLDDKVIQAVISDLHDASEFVEQDVLAI